MLATLITRSGCGGLEVREEITISSPADAVEAAYEADTLECSCCWPMVIAEFEGGLLKASPLAYWIVCK